MRSKQRERHEALLELLRKMHDKFNMLERLEQEIAELNEEIRRCKEGARS